MSFKRNSIKLANRTSNFRLRKTNLKIKSIESKMTTKTWRTSIWIWKRTIENKWIRSMARCRLWKCNLKLLKRRSESPYTRKWLFREILKSLETTIERSNGTMKRNQAINKQPWGCWKDIKQSLLISGKKKKPWEALSKILNRNWMKLCLRRIRQSSNSINCKSWLKT
jgi:hypothetical protein